MANTDSEYAGGYASAGPHAPAQSRTKMMLSAGIGHFIEWFDFGLYGTLAAIIASNFFASGDPVIALLKSFAVFGSGFLMRPLGGLFFGSMGDRLGRRKVLVTVIVITSCSTFVMGILPTWHQVGMLAPVLLVLTRLVQGFAAGGESSGVITYLAESAKPNRRATLTCWSENFSFMAFVCGSGLVLILTHTLGETAMNEWGWRIPFLLAGPLGWIGLYLRNHLQDSPEFQALLNSRQTEAAPLRRAVITGRRALGFCIGFVVIKAVMHWMLQAFIPAYLVTTLHYPALDAYTITTLGLLFVAVLVPFMGYLSDRIGRKPLMLAGCLGLILFAWPAMKLLTSGEVFSAMLGLGLLGLCIAAFDGASNAAMAELFPTRIRFGGVAIAYNLAVAFFGGVTPWSLAWLLTVTGNPLSPALYVMMAALVTLLTVLRARETAGQPLRA